jgi:hypothetical protein
MAVLGLWQFNSRLTVEQHQPGKKAAQRPVGKKDALRGNAGAVLAFFCFAGNAVALFVDKNNIATVPFLVTSF